MISSQMPTNNTQTSQEYYNSLYTTNSNFQEPLLQQQDGSLSQTPPKDTSEMQGFEKLLSIEGVHIDKIPFLGKTQCCGPPPRIDIVEYGYEILGVRSFGEEGTGKSRSAILQGKENIEYSSNCWCPTGHRAFDIEINHEEDMDSKPNNFQFLKLERKFICSFLCMARPEMTVTLVEECKNEKLGRIENPIQCCMDFRMKIYDANNFLRYVIKAGCCDWGVTCPGSCYIKETVMTVYDPFGNAESKLEILEDDEGSYSFSMIFPKESNKSDRALLIAGVMMIGKTFFEGKNPICKCCELCEAACQTFEAWK